MARLATVDEAGYPHVVPVCYATDGHAYYSPLDAKPKTSPVSRLKRVRNIRANPRVALLIDHYEEDWARLRFVMVQGRAELLDGGPEWKAARDPARGEVSAVPEPAAPAGGAGHQDRPRPRGPLEPRLVSARAGLSAAVAAALERVAAGRPLGRADGVALIEAAPGELPEPSSRRPPPSGTGARGGRSPTRGRCSCR